MRDAAALLAHASRSQAAGGGDYRNTTTTNATLGALGPALPPLADVQVFWMGWAAEPKVLAAEWTCTALHGGG